MKIVNMNFQSILPGVSLMSDVPKRLLNLLTHSQGLLLCLPSTYDNYLYMYIYIKYKLYVSYVENKIFDLSELRPQ